MQCKFVVCIPVYNNPQTIVGVIESCLKETSFPILVVDDGSDVSVETLFRAEDSAHSERVSFFRHSQNQGKGVALQSGFKQAVAQGYTHLIAIDGDGQHLASDIPKLVQSSLENPWALVVGDRNMQTANVPESSSFGKKFSNFWVKYQTSVGVADSQSGFRIYPLFFVQNMKFFCKKYDFEIEILIRLIWKNIPVKNVKVSVLYFPKEKRVSHFHKWKDNYRISVLNTFLTVASLLREPASPFKSSLALGIGVFIGTTPLYGLHTGIAAGLAVLGRLNFVYLWLGTNISIPPMVPFLLWGSNYFGQMMSSTESTDSQFVGKAVLIGSPILGLVLGVSAFAILFLFKKLFVRKKTDKAWAGENKNKAGISIVRFILKMLGLRAAYFCLYFIVFYYFLFSFRTRKSFNEYWKVIRPEMGWAQRQLRMYLQILTFAKTLVDRNRQKDSREVLYKYEYDLASHEFMKHFKAQGGGAVAVASHVGGWEMAMTFFSQVPTDKVILAVMHGISGQDAHNSSESGQRNSEVLFSNLEQNSILKIRRYLADEQIVGMMGDRPLTNSFEMIPFFGKLACFDTTPIRTALSCKVDVYFVFSVKVDSQKYKVFTVKGQSDSTKSQNERVDEILLQYVRGLEKIVDQYPEQWFNFFPFWSEGHIFKLISDRRN